MPNSSTTSPIPPVSEGVTLFLGQTRSGKTTLAVNMLAELGRRTLIFDPSRSAALNRFPALDSRRRFRDFFFEESSGQWVRTVRFSRIEDYVWAAKTAEHWKGVIWFIDDATKLFKAKELRQAASECASTGRHWGEALGVELWVAAHRPTHVHPDIRSQALRIFSFCQREPADLSALADRAGQHFAADVAKLERRKHEWLGWGSDPDDLTEFLERCRVNKWGDVHTVRESRGRKRNPQPTP